MSEWSEVVKGKLKIKFKTCLWKECPDDVDKCKRYSVDVKNPRIATKTEEGYNCTIIGNTPLPPSKVTSWSIKILKSKRNDGAYFYVGVAPFDINQNENGNYLNNGWYLNCFHSILFSGPPHNYMNSAYGPRKGDGKYVHTGDSVGVLMDTAKGNLSFVLNGVNHGAAFKRIPPDKPLVPCVLLLCKGDSVKLVI